MTERPIDPNRFVTRRNRIQYGSPLVEAQEGIARQHGIDASTLIPPADIWKRARRKPIRKP